MTRDVRWYLVGSLVLVTLAGCARNFVAQREPWRHEAEVQCLKSGSVKESPAVALLSPIEGPGVCGADFPFKVSALGETTTLGYTDDPVRPPGGIPQAASGRTLGTPPGYLRVPDAPPASAPADPPKRSPSSRSAVSRETLPPPRENARHEKSRPAWHEAPTDYAEPGFSPAPLDKTSPYRDPPRTRDRVGALREPAPRPAPVPEPAPVETTSPYPPSYPPMGERVPVSPSREPAATGAVAASVTPAATLACPLVSALDRWVAEAVQPSAQRWFGQPVVEIKQISAYSCRGMNGNPNAHISEHAFGNALDIAAFTLADGHVITVRRGWRGTPEEQGFLRDVQASACETFTTVLAPGSNVFHYDHIHVDLMRRSSGRRICQPGAVSGEEVAARARGAGGSYAARRPDDGPTGSVAAKRRVVAHRPGGRLPDARFEEDRERPTAVPGED